MEIFILPWDKSYRAGRGRWTRWDTCPGTLLACTVWTNGQWRLDSPARTSWWSETPCCPLSSSHSRRCSSENTHTWQKSQHDTSMNLFQAACPWNDHCSCWLCEDNLNGLEGKRRVTQADAHFFPSPLRKEWWQSLGVCPLFHLPSIFLSCCFIDTTLSTQVLSFLFH